MAESACLQAKQLAFTFHFADGSSSVRPNAAITARCDPHTDNAQVIGCSFYGCAAAPGASTADDATLECVHWSLLRPAPNGVEHGGDVAGGFLEASWRVVHEVLAPGGRGRRLVVPNCQRVLRALELELGRAAESACDRGTSTGRDEGLYWLDPRVMGQRRQTRTQGSTKELSDELPCVLCSLPHKRSEGPSEAPCALRLRQGARKFHLSD